MFNYIKKSFMVLLFMSILGGASSASAIAQPETQHDNVIVMFYKSSCPYCKYMQPIMNQIKAEYAGKITVISIEISSNPTTYKKQYGFRTVPTVIYFKNGKEMARHGSNNKAVTVNFVRNKITSIWGI